MLLNKDLFLLRLINSVSEWYDEHYFAGQIELEGKKAIHIQVMKDHYNHWRFIACKNLNKERIKFLEEVQEKVNNYQEF